MKKLLVAATLLVATGAYAQTPEIQVTATRIAVPVDNVGDDVNIITKEQIKKYGFTSVADVLKYVAGVNISNEGGPGKQTSVFMLGLPSKHILVLIDGVPVYDPSTPAGTTNFEWLDLSNVERIEVLKGPQGALYGSDAIAGVINIITRKPKESSFKVSLEGGKYLTFKEKARGDLVLKDGYLSFVFTNFKTNGFSATNSKSLYYEPDNDGFRYKTGWLSWGYSPTNWLKLSGNLKVKGGSVDFDAMPTPDAKTDYDSFFTDFKADATVTDNFAFTLKVSHNKEDRDTPWGLYRGIVRYFTLQPIYYITDSTFVTGGVNYRQEKAVFPNTASAHLRSAFIELHGSLAGITGTAAIRRDFHSEYGDKTTYKLSASYLIKPTETKIRGQYGTGFRAPSLYQLYGPFGANPNLKPETSEGWNVGVDQKLPCINGVFSLTYFKNHVWNMIDMPWWQGIYKYENYNKAITEGVELGTKVKVLRWLSLYGNYTHLRAKEFNPTTGSWEKLARRPKFSYTVGIDSKFDKFKVSVWALHYSDREDSNGETLGGFTTLNAFVSYKLNKKVKFHLKAVNLTNKKYELAYGYNTMGRAAFAGVDFSF